MESMVSRSTAAHAHAMLLSHGFKNQNLHAMQGAHLALEGPTNFKDAGYSLEFIVDMHSLDWFLFFAFWVECLMKCIAFGFAGTTEAYLRSNKANILDFSVVMITTIDVILVKVFAVDAEWVRIFRLLHDSVSFDYVSDVWFAYMSYDFLAFEA